MYYPVSNGDEMHSIEMSYMYLSPELFNCTMFSSFNIIYTDVVSRFLFWSNWSIQMSGVYKS